MDTRDLSSYYPGYDDYCEDLENRAKVPYSDYEKLETKITGYNGLLDDIKSIFSEDFRFLLWRKCRRHFMRHFLQPLRQYALQDL